MQFTQDSAAGANRIRSYAPGEVTVNDSAVRQPMIVGPAHFQLLGSIGGVSELTREHAMALLAQKPEVVLIGTGLTQAFPPKPFLTELAKASVGAESMSTASACRTYNVLTSERRAVLAVLFP